MRTITLKVTDVSIKRQNSVKITTNTKNDIDCLFEFSADWNEFTIRTAVFSGSGVTKSVLISDNKAIVPWECMTVPDNDLSVSVSGLIYSEDTTLFKTHPTVYGVLGPILQGADIEADVSSIPTPTLAEQILGKFEGIENGEAQRVAAEIQRETNAANALNSLADATANANEIVETVQNKLDNGDFVGEQGERGDPGSPKGAFATKALLTSSYPTGNANIYVVTADGGWYYWSGAEWVKGGLYQSAVYDVLNRCINPLPSSLTGFSFTLSNGSYDATDANDKHIKFTATALYGQFTLSDPAVVADFKGHKIYVAAEVKTTAANTTFMLHNGGAIQDSLIVPVSIDGGYSRVSKIISYSLTANAFLLRVIDYRNTGWTEISAKKFMYVDLTAKFGAGNEPSVEIFEKYVEYINNGSSFISGYVASVAAAKAYYSETSGRSLTANSIENSNILEYVENIINVYGVMSNKRICRTSVRKFGQNNIWMMHSIAYKEAIELETFATGTEFGGDTDWIGPYQVASLLNGDGNTVGFTGGNHKYPNIDGNIDANTISCDIYLDGKLITEYGTYNGKETVIQIHNQIMGYNTVSLGRYILDERVTYTIYNNKIDVDVRIIPLEDVSISLYYGMQVPSVNLFSAIHFVGGIVDSPQIIGDLSSGPYNTNFIDSVVFASEEVSLAEHLDNTVSLGLRDHIRSTDPCFLTNPQKAYAQLITTAHTFVQYEKLAWRGYYQINDII